MTRTLVPSTSPYAPIIGFSRAVRVGNYISVGGTAPIDTNGKTVGVGDPAAQARQCLETIKAALEQAGAEAALAGDEARAAGGAALLSVLVGKQCPLFSDAVNVRRLVAHHALVVGADVPVADVIAPDDEDVGFILGH